MHPDSDKNKKLIRQYPFIRDILRVPSCTRGGAMGDQVDDLTITVQRADGGLMYRQANNVGLGDYGFVFEVEGSHAYQVGRQSEHLIAVGKDGRILGVLHWPRNDAEKSARPLLYAKAIFRSCRDDAQWSNPVWDRVETLAWVTVEAWHDDTGARGEPGSRFGALRSRSVKITVYGKPDIGFERLEKESSVTRHLRVTMELLSHGMRNGTHEIIALGGMVNELCAQFEEEVFASGLKDVRYASVQFGPTRVNCGDDSIVLEGHATHLHLCRNGRDGIYVAGMGGTIPQLRAMVRGVIRDWANPSLRALLAPPAADHAGGAS